ncbi:MAG: CD1871A family CXXC motif-containing protein [Eubacteriales bacterium]|nr:CD1871A family CXXC motif-containing protein [Eubacteriales bacterium]
MKKQRAWIVLSIIAVLLIAVGIAANEPATVLKKAINICLECIGIG